MNDQAVPTLRIISADTLRAKVQFGDLIEPVARAFQESSAKKAQNGVVVMFPAERPELGDVYVKTGVLSGHPTYIVKVSPWFAANAANGQPQGGFLAVFDSATGHTLALLNDEHYLSDIRTAAAGAVAARLFAPSPITTAAVLGSGVQAYRQPLALYGERPFDNLLVWARSPQKADILKHRLAGVLPNVHIETAGDLEQVVRKADVLITATLSREPLVRGDWLRPGQHITAVGADDPTKCELDCDALNRSRIFVDSVDANIKNGDLRRAIERGQFAATQLAGEIGEVLSGRLIGRTSEADITIAKLVGIGAQDLVAAETALEKIAACA
ncbi:MAG TPA: ornithine cyclodeaminase family protein [Aestuariivirga sp.]|nr:ornithine cyclodeaminase family protein [Aestuariivirga sp.]